MKNILIIYPHWPPSNLAGVHRARLIANFLPLFNWHPIVLTVHPDYYEEKPDWDLIKTVSPDIEVHKVKAKKIKEPRIIGDIGLRSFKELKKKALEIIREKEIHFIWIPIPSFYTAILGRIIYNRTRVPYGIDYIDPWVRDISNRKNIRSILSILIARILEPYAIKKTSLISGVAEAYYKPAVLRNFKNRQPVQVAMPYGFDSSDHNIKLQNIGFPWDKYPSCIPYIYAGAFLPNSGMFIDSLFKSIAVLKSKGKFDNRIKLFFIGTGEYSHKSIKEFAVENAVEEHVVEIRDRFPYLHILNFLSAAKGVLLIGSTEKHYTASKTFQSILSRRPVFGILHAESTAVEVFIDCNADAYLLKYSQKVAKEYFIKELESFFESYIHETKAYNPDYNALDKYSSKQSALALVKAIEAIENK
jgi:hypothetical protein